MFIFLACSNPTGEALSDDKNQVTTSPEPTYSTVFPFGLKYQLHANSKSVNTSPPHSSYLTEPVGNTDNNLIEIPSILTADNFSNRIYFDSKAQDGGNGSIEKPHNTLNLIMEQDYPDNCALLLKAGSIFFLSSLNAGTQKTDIYFGSYSEGEMPIITNVDDFSSPTQFVPASSFTGQNITVNGVHIVGGGTGTYDRLVSIGGANLTFAHCHLESIYTLPVGFLFNIFKGGAENMVVFHNEIAFARDDIWYASSNFSYTIVSNYFHHANMGIYGIDNFDPEDRSTWQSRGGDILHLNTKD